MSTPNCRANSAINASMRLKASNKVSGFGPTGILPDGVG